MASRDRDFSLHGVQAWFDLIRKIEIPKAEKRNGFKREGLDRNSNPFSAKLRFGSYIATLPGNMLVKAANVNRTCLAVLAIC